MKTKILISACLLGEKVRYDGESKTIDTCSLKKLFNLFHIFPYCPEEYSGLSIPRTPAEIIENNKNVQIVNKNGVNLTDFFNKGAAHALEICKKNNITLALLKENSPSCGVHFTYDGTFTNKLVHKSGFTTRLLKKHNITVYSENDIPLLIK